VMTRDSCLKSLQESDFGIAGAVSSHQLSTASGAVRKIERVED
jgi:hypothetical protein